MRPSAGWKVAPCAAGVRVALRVRMCRGAGWHLRAAWGGPSGCQPWEHTHTHPYKHPARPCTLRATPRPPPCSWLPQRLGEQSARRWGVRRRRAAGGALRLSQAWEDSGSPLEVSGGFAHPRRAGRDNKSWVSAAPELTLQHLRLPPPAPLCPSPNSPRCCAGEPYASRNLRWFFLCWPRCWNTAHPLQSAKKKNQLGKWY